MDDKNFDSLKNLKAPDSWIENALSIPAMQEKKPIFFIRYSRSLMAVACLILVCTISLIVVLNKGDKPVLVVDPQYETTQQDETENGENDTQNNNDNDKNNNKKPAPTNSKDNGDAPHEGTVAATQNSTDKQEKPTQKPTTKPVIGPQRPTEKPESPTEDKVLPTPTVRPTAPVSVKPTTKPIHRPDAPVEPTEGTPTSPGGPMTPPGQDGSGYQPPATVSEEFRIAVDEYYLTSSEKILCTLVDSNSTEIIVDAVADVYKIGTTTYASYTVYKSDIPYSGVYTCYFSSDRGYYIHGITMYLKK